MRQIVLDTETTGLSAQNGDRVIEFAGLEMIDRQLTGNNLYLLIDPERDIGEGAIAIHGITREKLAEANAPVFADVAEKIADFLKDAELIIHNAPFDEGFLDMEFARLGMQSIKNITTNVIDTLAMARERYPGQKNSLDALCNRLDVDRSKRVLHGALIDCELLSEVYLAMTRSQFSLVDELMSPAQTTAQQNQQQNYALQHPPLLILPPNAEEKAAHEAYVQLLDKNIGGECLWHQWQIESEKAQS